MGGRVTYQERLHVPLAWWIIGSLLVATVWIALIKALPGAVAWPITGLAVALLIGLFTTYGSTQIRVEDATLFVGRAHIACRYLGRIEALDAEQTRLTTGVKSDARAFLVLRPYLRRSVRIEITDPTDPVPYWLVNSRRAEELVEALSPHRDRGYDGPKV